MKELNAAMAKSLTSSSQPFTFGYAPPKEGRVPPLPSDFVGTSSVTNAREKIGAELQKDFGSAVKGAKNGGKQKQLIEQLAETTSTSSALSKTITTKESLSVPTKQPVPVGESKKEKALISTKEDDDFDELLEKVISLLPNEMHQRALLSEIRTSGAERMHEVGLRTREFKRLFEAWEELHLVFNKKTVLVQDDVISYLRRREKALIAKNAHSKNADSEPFELASTIRNYEIFRWTLQKLGDVLFPWIRPYFGDHMGLHAQLYSGGRGIVYTAGTDQAPFVLTSIGILRELGCNLPIEVMYLGDGDLDVDARERLEEIPGVITRDIRLMVKDEGWALAGWAGKPFAILLSSFREVIFIDADALFLQNPEILFEEKGYVDTGALFFYDRLMKADGKRHWMESVLPRPVSRKARKSRMWGESDHMQESGVVVVDTYKHFIPLLVVSRMNGPDRDGNADKGITGVYDMLFGDKETFWLSWELVGSQSYAFHSGPAGIIGNLPAAQANISHETDTITTGEVTRISRTYSENVTMCAPQLLHISRDGSPIWFNGWILANKFERQRSPIAQLEMFMKEPEVYMEPESWTIGESNSCCLRNVETYEFTQEEKDAIKSILKIAFKVGAVGRKGGSPRRDGENLYGS